MKLNLILALSFAVFSANASIVTYNSLDFGGNAAMQTSWLAAIGESPDFFIDFNSLADGLNVNGVPQVGGLTLNDTNGAGGFAVSVECTAGGIGGSHPIGACAVEHDQRAYLQMVFASPVDYVSFFDIDSGGTSVIVDFVGGTSETFLLDTTAADGNSAEFIGIFRNNQPLISGLRMTASGSSTWGIDDVGFGTLSSSIVPEPSTIAFLSGGILLVGALRYRKQRRLIADTAV